MTLKENSNGNYFAAWLQEYKERLQQVQLRGRLNGSDQRTALASSAQQEHLADDNSEAAPAWAGETLALFRQQAMV